MLSGFLRQVCTWVRICTEKVAAAASAPHLPFHYPLVMTMPVCSSVCSPAGREGVSRQPRGCWEGAQRGCGQQKLFALPKQKEPRALLLPSLLPQWATCRGRTSSAGGRWLPPPAPCYHSMLQTGTVWGGWLWPRQVWEACGWKTRPLLPHGAGGADWGHTPRLCPLWLPGSLSHSTGTGDKLFPLLFSPAQSPCVPLNHELAFDGLPRKTNPACRTASSNLGVICSDYLFPDNTQGPFQTWMGRKHSCLWADSYK